MNTNDLRFELIRRCCEGKASTEELAQLDSLLRVDAEFRRAYVRYMNLDVALQAHAGSQAVVTDMLVLPQRSVAKRWTNRLTWRPLMAAAVFLLLGAMTWLLFPSPEKKRSGALLPEVAFITQATGAKWSGADWHTGDRLRPGTVKLVEGLVRLRFFSGATLLLRGPVELELCSDMEARVRHGVVTATVPPVAQGFTLTTEGWRLVDRGTVFGVHALEGGAAELHVLTGQVDVHREGEATALEKSITTGQATRLKRDGVLATFAATPDFFPTESEMLTQANSEQHARWLSASAALRKDARLALYFDFDAAERDLGIVKNLAPRASGGSDGVLIGGEWTEGRWPWKRAVEFRRAGDLIRVMPQLKLHAATLAAWVRFDPSVRQRRTLMLSPLVRSGQFYWLADAGAPDSKGDHLLFIKTPRHGSDLVNTAQNVILEKNRQRWQHLAVVHDVAAMQMRFFVNGRLVSEQALRDAEPLDLEQIVMGNWGYDTQQASNFAGRMDELAIFSDVLQADEILTLYQNGMP
jgi:hypothetical protein